jgi:tetratricopeptide (TPR) repeat protein
MKYRIFILLSFSFFQFTSGQSPSKLLKEGKEQAMTGKCNEAINFFTRAIEAKSSFTDAYLERAKCYILMKEYLKAVDDCKFLVNIKPKNEDYQLLLAQAYYFAGKPAQGAELLAHLVIEDPSKKSYFEWAIKCKLALKENEGAVNYCNEALAQFEEDHFFTYMKGVSLDSARNHQLAVLSYERAIRQIEEKYHKEERKPFVVYYEALGTSLMKIKRYDNAAGYFSQINSIDTGYNKAYELMGDANLGSGKYQQAVSRYTRAIKSNPNNLNLYYKRGTALKNQKQYTEAINNFNQLLSVDSTNILALLERAFCADEIGEYDVAQSFYKKAKRIDPYNRQVDQYIDASAKKMYEVNREDEKPELKITTPDIEGFALLVPVSRSYLEVKGRIIDKSKILKIIIDEVDAKFSKDSLNPHFSASVSLERKNQVVFKVTDIYYNTLSVTYSLKQFEKNNPIVVLSDPIPSGNQLYVGKNSGNILKLHGHIDDESQIRSIIVNNNHAVYSLSELNPEFNVELNIAKIDTLVFIVTDAFENTSVTRYILNRKAITESVVNPMGITWVVFIENGSYANFPSLEGPAKDRETLKNALSSYRIDNFITKKNMTKDEMERFFSIELRQQLKSAQVNSLVVWYAGHGKFQNENGYWIPVNAKMNDEFTYFQITNLKGYISTYKFLNHVLIISDACETGSAFCANENDSPDPGDCMKSDKARLQSAQVFTSSNKEKSADNSLFANIFCGILSANTDPCIPIEKIRTKVSKTVTLNQSQRPMFGHIQGLEHKGGSFYFMRML